MDGRGWTEKKKIDGTPYHAGFHNRVRLLDVNGSGTPDILWGDAGAYKYIDLQGGEKPYVLTGVQNGLGKSTTLEYSTSTNEMLAAAATGNACSEAPDTDRFAAAWCSKMPTVTHVVKRVIERDNITIRGRPPAEYVTEYEYRDPVYEGRQREFRGFSRARARRLGDANSPTDVSESVFLLGECRDPATGTKFDGFDQSHYCAPPNRWGDNPYEALKGLPVETHKMDAQGVHLATTENEYTIRTLYTGLDGREVRHAFLSKADSLLYDTGLESPGRTGIERRGFIDDNAPIAEEVATPQYQPGMAHLQTESVVDLYGNKEQALNRGCIGGAACPDQHGLRKDEIIKRYTVPSLESHAGGWMWRTKESWVEGDYNATHQQKRGHTITDYDSLGRPETVRADLFGSEAVDRAAQGAASVPHSSSVAADGLCVQSRTEYDQFGNAIRTRGVNGRCAEVSYGEIEDDRYGLFAVQEAISVTGNAHGSLETAPTGACAAEGEALTTQASYDHGIGVVTLATDLNLRDTKAVYDEFGRITALHKPSAYKDGAGPTHQTHPSVSIQYFLPTDLGGGNHSIIFTETQDGTDEDDTVRQIQSYAYVDGFGRTLVTLSEADPTTGPGQGNDGGAWIAGSLLEWDQKSAVSKKFLPFFWDGDPMAFSYATVPTTAYGRQRYDAFGRQVQTYDLDGTITLQSKYHALSTDLWDAADLYTGQHQGSYASERKDGHGRTIQTTERFRAHGVMERRHVQTTYLPTGEPLTIERVREGDSATVKRWMRYDSLGRMVLNVEPNTTVGFTPDEYVADTSGIDAWRYQYNRFGDLMATSDARGCGQNFFYDSAGRILGEDYAPCEDTHEAYSDPRDGNGVLTDKTALEVAYFYDDATDMPAVYKGVAPSGWEAASTPSAGFTLGRAIAVFDRGSASFTSFDGRGRTVKTQTRVATPTVSGLNGGGPAERPQPKSFGQRYATRVYSREFEYDAADREVQAETGADNLVAADGTTKLVPELLSEDKESSCSTEYSARGSVKEASSSYGSLISSITRSADNLVSEIVYGDAAQTRTAYLYDERRRVSTVQTYRGPPASGAWDPTNPNSSTTTAPEPTRQLVLQDEEFEYDVVGNPVQITDWRDAQDWPEGAKPVTKNIEYDDLYRATRIQYEYADGDDTWKSPFQAEIEASSDQEDSRRAEPSPHIKFAARILEQTFEYDWVGNNRKTTDDADGFYDRSLGNIDGGPTQPLGAKPYQLQSAHLGGDNGGRLAARYDAAGYMTSMALERDGTCLSVGDPLGSDTNNLCNQHFRYEWDEVGRLARARRWDNDLAGVAEIDTFDPATDGTLAADLRYSYDASDQRVIKDAFDDSAVLEKDKHSFTLYVFETLELRRARFAEEYKDIAESGVSDYEISRYTVVPYLLANGVRLARLVYHETGTEPADGSVVPEEDYQAGGAPGDVNGQLASNGELHVFFELGDHLGSTSVVLDKATGELVERATFQGYGGAESDYRPGRWKSFREDYRFTGKEEDVEVGLQYFGKRYLNPLLGRWVSADPLEIHQPGEADFNVYAYVSGQVLKNVDPLGLQEAEAVNQSSVAENDIQTDATAEASQSVPTDNSYNASHPNCPNGECTAGPNGEMNFEDDHLVYGSTTSDGTDIGEAHAQQKYEEVDKAKLEVRKAEIDLARAEEALRDHFKEIANKNAVEKFFHDLGQAVCSTVGGTCDRAGEKLKGKADDARDKLNDANRNYMKAKRNITARHNTRKAAKDAAARPDGKRPMPQPKKTAPAAKRNKWKEQQKYKKPEAHRDSEKHPGSHYHDANKSTKKARGKPNVHHVGPGMK